MHAVVLLIRNKINNLNITYWILIMMLHRIVHIRKHTLYQRVSLHVCVCPSKMHVCIYNYVLYVSATAYGCGRKTLIPSPSCQSDQSIVILTQ